ncbi:MAG: HU family DNA-binding protein [Firmicutes bacterium]|nr:HU family DNA-binding protein [Bacillota bacterium]NLO66616.1 HU family DNA-binding protein [Bacillota bacterium]
MNKAELIASVAEKSGMTKKAASEAVEAVFATISETLANEEKVTIVGFGTFEVRERKARKGVNPATKEEIMIPATKVPAFRPGKSLREVVAP